MNAPSALIAEDEPLLAQGLRADLQRLWPELRVLALASDGHSAVEQALALAPTVCFFDIRMPGLSGLEAAQALAEDWPDGRPFPLLVFITAYDQYALQAGSLTSVNGGLGNDYAVFSTVRNSNTGLYAGQAQGSWFTPAVVPPDVVEKSMTT